MKRRVIGVVAVLAAVALVAGACAKKAATSTGSPSATGSPTQPALTVIAAGTLTVGSCLDYKPFEYYEGGTLKGFDVEIMDAIAQKLGLTVTWKKANFDTIFTALAANQFDAVAAASTITAQRQQTVDFSNPYYNARQALTVNSQKTPTIKTTADLTSGMIVGVQKGTTGRDWAEANLAPKGIQIKTYTNAPDAFTDLEAGQIQGVINDEPSSQAEVASRPGLAVVEPIDTGEHYGFAVSKDNLQLLAAMNQALAAIIADGTWAKIFQKWFPGLPVPPEFAGS